MLATRGDERRVVVRRRLVEQSIQRGHEVVGARGAGGEPTLGVVEDAEQGVERARALRRSGVGAARGDGGVELDGGLGHARDIATHGPTASAP